MITAATGGDESPTTEPIARFALRFTPHFAANEMRFALTPAWLNYRTVANPDQSDYEALLPSNGGGPGGTVIRTASYRGNGVILIGRIETETLAEFASSIDQVARLAVQRKSAFVALWQPRWATRSGVLLKRFFIPVQRKKVLVAKSCCAPEIAEWFPKWRIEMLDSDKM
jgi:hypothetical protein